MPHPAADNAILACTMDGRLIGVFNGRILSADNKRAVLCLVETGDVFQIERQLSNLKHPGAMKHRDILHSEYLGEGKVARGIGQWTYSYHLAAAARDAPYLRLADRVALTFVESDCEGVGEYREIVGNLIFE